MRILVLGAGGREHAITWKLSLSNPSRLFCAPGNGGIAEAAECVPLKADDPVAVRQFALQNSIELVVIGPEGPLVAGVADALREERIPVFGPDCSAAAIEGSKAFAKAFMERWRIPTARHVVFTRGKSSRAHRYIDEHGTPVVVKADGLAAGKGAFVTENALDAHAVIDDLFTRGLLGAASDRIIVEEFMRGDEASVFALTDGRNFVILPPAQDHKRVFDGDRGPNTGGMGAYAPTALIDGPLLGRIIEEIIEPAIRGLAAEGKRYLGCLYAGLMITAEGPKVIEFNARLGDPETQAVLPVIDVDFPGLLLACATGGLDGSRIIGPSRTAATVVIVSQGYPGRCETGKEIGGLAALRNRDDVVVFHSGTRRDGDRILTSGGRVLSVTGVAGRDDLQTAIASAYDAVGQVRFEGAYFRSDIAARGLRYTGSRNAQ